MHHFFTYLCDSWNQPEIVENKNSALAEIQGTWTLTNAVTFPILKYHIYETGDLEYEILSISSGEIYDFMFQSSESQFSFSTLFVWFMMQSLS